MNSHKTGLRVQYQGFRKGLWHTGMIFSPIIIWLSMGWLQSGTLFNRVSPPPHINELIKVGPVEVKKGRERSVEKLYFYSRDNSKKYSFESRWLHSNAALDKSLLPPAAYPVVYLWVNEENKTMKVWRITINGVEVLSYSDAVYAYEAITNANEKLKIATFFMFSIGLVGFFKIVRI